MNNIQQASFTHPHTTGTVVMMKPEDFGYNEETGQDNEFMHTETLRSTRQVREQALLEFDRMVATLRENDVEVLVFEKEDDRVTPDAVFPNNWFSTTPSGILYVYPLKAATRRRERRVEQLTKLLKSNGFLISKVRPVGNIGAENEVGLEGTGVIVFDHKTNTAYASISERCNEELLREFTKEYGCKTITFNSWFKNGPIYHTNVLLSIGATFAVVCLDVVPDNEKFLVQTALTNGNIDIINISREQLTQFCGNVLQVHNSKGEKIIAMSKSAYNGFTESQRKRLSRHGKLLSFDISQIESIGGGSVRCMLAEIFLPRVNTM